MKFAMIAAVSSLVIATTTVTGAEVNIFNYKCRGVEIQAAQGPDTASEKRRVATDGYLILESKPGLVTPILVQLRDRAYYSVTELETVELRRQNTQGSASFVLSGSNLALMGPAFGTTPTTLAGYTTWQRQLKEGGTSSGYAKITLTFDRKLTAALNTRRIGGKRLSNLLAEESLDDDLAKALGLNGLFRVPDDQMFDAMVNVSFLANRANHAGEQTADTISDFASEVRKIMAEAGLPAADTADDKKKLGASSNPPAVHTLAGGDIIGDLFPPPNDSIINIAAGAVVEAKLADNSATSTKIKDGEVKNPDLGADSVTSDKIKDGTVTTADMADAAITNAKLGDNAVTSNQIVDNTIVNADIAVAAAIAPTKLALSGVSTDVLNGLGSWMDLASSHNHHNLYYTKTELSNSNAGTVSLHWDNVKNRSIVNGDVAVNAAIAWGKISKAGSSLADLETRSASDLASGTLPNARLAMGHGNGIDADSVDGVQGAAIVQTSRTVNGHPLSADVTVTKADIGLENVTNEVQLKADSNLADLPDKTAARANLGLGDLSTLSHDSIPYDLTVNGKVGSKGILLKDVGTAPQGAMPAIRTARHMLGTVREESEAPSAEEGFADPAPIGDIIIKNENGGLIVSQDPPSPTGANTYLPGDLYVRSASNPPGLLVPCADTTVDSPRNILHGNLKWGKLVANDIGNGEVMPGKLGVELISDWDKATNTGFYYSENNASNHPPTTSSNKFIGWVVSSGDSLTQYVPGSNPSSYPSTFEVFVRYASSSSGNWSFTSWLPASQTKAKYTADWNLAVEPGFYYGMSDEDHGAPTRYGTGTGTYPCIGIVADGSFNSGTVSYGPFQIAKDGESPNLYWRCRKPSGWDKTWTVLGGGGGLTVHDFIGSQHSGAENAAAARASITSDDHDANHVFHGNGTMGKVSNTDMTSQGVTESDKVLTSDGSGNVVWTSKTGDGNFAMNEKVGIEAAQANDPVTPSGIYDVMGGLGIPGTVWNHLFVSKHRDGNNDGWLYGAQIAIPLLGGGDEMYFRRSENSATYGNWHKVLKDSVGTNEINDAAVTPAKTGMSLPPADDFNNANATGFWYHWGAAANRPGSGAFSTVMTMNMGGNGDWLGQLGVDIQYGKFYTRNHTNSTGHGEWGTWTEVGGGNGGGDMYKSTYDPLHLDKVKSVYDGAIGNAQLADGAVNNAKISSAGQLADRVLTADGNGNTIWTGKATGVGDVTAGGDTTDGNIPIWTAVNKQLSNTGLYFLGAHGNAWETFNQWIIPNPQACDARFEPTIGSKGSAFNKNYGGDGSADSISRSDHTHFGLNRHDFKPYNNNAGQTVILDASFFEKTVIVYNTKTVATGGVVSLWLDWSVAASGNYTGRVIKIVAVAQHDAAFDTGALVISVMGPFGYLSFGNVMSGGYAVVRYQTDNSVYSPGFCAILECTPDPNGSWMVLNGDTHGWSVYNSP